MTDIKQVRLPSSSIPPFDFHHPLGQALIRKPFVICSHPGLLEELREAGEPTESSGVAERLTVCFGVTENLLRALG